MTFTVPETGGFTPSKLPTLTGQPVTEPVPAVPKPVAPAPTPAPTTGGTTPATGLTPDQQSAIGLLNAELANFGLSSLADVVWNWVKEGRSSDQIFLDLRQTPEYKARFPAMSTLAQRGQAITEQQYVDYEKQTAEILRSAGIDPSLFDVTQGLINNVAPTELNDRVKLAEQATYQADQTVVGQLRSLYGLSQGDLTSYFLDPNSVLPRLQQQFAAAQISGSAIEAGYGGLTAQEAEQLNAQGVSQAQAQSGFSKLAGEQQLFNALPGENFAGITRAQQLGAAFTGDAQSQQAIEQERQRRLAEFKAGGGFATGTSSSGQGIVGV